MVRKHFKCYFINLSRFSYWKNLQQTSEECDVRILPTTTSKAQHVDLNENVDFGEGETSRQYGIKRHFTKVTFDELANETECRFSTLNGENSLILDRLIPILEVHRNLLISGNLEESNVHENDSLLVSVLRNLTKRFKYKPVCSMADFRRLWSKTAVPCFTRQTMPMQNHFLGMNLLMTRPYFPIQPHYLDTRGHWTYFKKPSHFSQFRSVHTSSTSFSSTFKAASKTGRSLVSPYSQRSCTKTYAHGSVVTNSTLPQENEGDVIITEEITCRKNDVMFTESKHQNFEININQNAHGREWEYTEFGHQYMLRGKPGFHFSIMSYNILAQNLLDDNCYLYKNCEPDFLDWQYRRQLLLGEVKTHLPDILCLQEVNKEHYESFFKRQLRNLGYEGEYIKRSGNKHDGCATLYQTKKFTLDQVFPLEYFCGNTELLDRDNVALVLRLKPVQEKYSAEKICVGNTHLLYNPRRGDIKLAQLVMLLAELDKCSFKSLVGSGVESYNPVILCGDLNSEPYSHLYSLLARGYLSYEGLCSHLISGQKEDRHKNPRYLEKNFFPSSLKISDQCQHIKMVQKRRGLEAKSESENPCSLYTQGSGHLHHKLNLMSAYTHRVERLCNREAEVTTHHGRADCTVDYIFYSVLNKHVEENRNKLIIKNVGEGKLKLIGRLGLMSQYELRKMGGMPNRFIPSDHLCLLAKFHLS